MEVHQPREATWCVLQYYLVRSWGLGIHRFHGMCLMAIRFAPMNIKKAPATNRMNSERPHKQLLRHPCLRTNPRRQKRTCGHANTCCQYRMLLFRPLQQKNNLYQSDVATCDFNVDVSDSIVDNRVCIGGTSDETHTQDVLAGCLLTVR